MDELNEQRQQRIKKLDHLRETGVAPYGTRFDVKDRAGRLIALHGEKAKEVLEQEKISCTFAGRVVALRRFGKAGFAVLQDGSDRLQTYLKKDLLSEQAYTVTEQLDLGDELHPSPPRQQRPDHERVEEAAVVGGDDHPARDPGVLAPGAPEAEVDEEERDQQAAQ